MPDEQDRLNTLQQAATNANSNGFVSIRVSDLLWLLKLATGRPVKRDVFAETPDE